ncbi:MAG: SIMPL domain-containing protein [Firmicutes bacterium]|nr:SIMPL domain-containing protein [Bacillota bacterium]
MLLKDVRWLRVLALASVLFLVSGASPIAPVDQALAAPAAEGDQKTISVTGRAVLEVSPDTAQVTLGVSQVAPTAAESYNRAANAMQRLVAAIREQGIAESEIRTSGLSIYPEYEWNREERRLVGYRTTATVTVTTRNLDRVGAIIDAGVAAGANEVQGIQFLVREEARHLDAALEQAVADARHKAEQVARAMGVKVGRPVQVQVHDMGSSMPVLVREAAVAADAGARAGMPVLPGTSRYQVEVQVVFGLE